MANNHILEHGKGGYERTLQILEESGIAVAGNDNRVLYIHRDNCLIGIAGFCNVDLDKFDNDGCFSVLDEVNAMAALNEMADRKADLKILTLHWGNEYIHRPSMMQRNMAYRLIDAGADIIVGHHSHVIQPYENIKRGIFSTHWVIFALTSLSSHNSSPKEWELTCISIRIAKR